MQKWVPVFQRISYFGVSIIVISLLYFSVVHEPRLRACERSTVLIRTENKSWTYICSTSFSCGVICGEGLYKNKPFGFNLDAKMTNIQLECLDSFSYLNI